MCEGRFQTLWNQSEDRALPSLEPQQDGVLADSETFGGRFETVKRIRGKKLPLTAAGIQGLRAEYARTIEPAHARAAETLNLERMRKAER